ncbi:MAG: hypothetical protein FD159_2037 [Syntrophaceae bacterium]|nr:MAG: hypothetical protein FD159_2037 [Syntrophaceae bacterium]
MNMRLDHDEIKSIAESVAQEIMPMLRPVQQNEKRLGTR